MIANVLAIFVHRPGADDPGFAVSPEDGSHAHGARVLAQARRSGRRDERRPPLDNCPGRSRTSRLHGAVASVGVVHQAAQGEKIPPAQEGRTAARRGLAGAPIQPSASRRRKRGQRCWGTLAPAGRRSPRSRPAHRSDRPFSTDVGINLKMSRNWARRPYLHGEIVHQRRRTGSSRYLAEGVAGDADAVSPRAFSPTPDPTTSGAKRGWWAYSICASGPRQRQKLIFIFRTY